MSTHPEPAAVTIARACRSVEQPRLRHGAKASRLMSTSPRRRRWTGPPPTDLTGVDDYMIGLTQFAQAVVPGSARILESVGDECNALILVTVEADFGGTKTTLPAARLYLLDENHKIKSEQVVFYVSQG